MRSNTWTITKFVLQLILWHFMIYRSYKWSFVKEIPVSFLNLDFWGNVVNEFLYAFIWSCKCNFGKEIPVSFINLDFWGKVVNEFLCSSFSLVIIFFLLVYDYMIYYQIQTCSSIETCMFFGPLLMQDLQPIDRFVVEEYLLDVLLFFNGWFVIFPYL